MACKWSLNAEVDQSPDGKIVGGAMRLARCLITAGHSLQAEIFLKHGVSA